MGASKPDLGARGTPSFRALGWAAGSPRRARSRGRGRGRRGGGWGRPLLPPRAAGLAAPSPLRAAHGAPDRGGGSGRRRFSGELGGAPSRSPSPLGHLPRPRGHHGVQRGGRHQRRLVGGRRGEGGRWQEAAPGLGGHRLAHLLQHRYDRGVRAPRRALRSLRPSARCCPPTTTTTPEIPSPGHRLGGGARRRGRTAGWAPRGGRGRRAWGRGAGPAAAAAAGLNGAGRGDGPCSPGIA